MILSQIIDPIVSGLDLDFLVEVNFFSIILRLILAVICGGILGIERAKKHHAAGFRTYILVCLGSTVAMITNEFIMLSTGSGDGARLGAQVISGIGFLGAGTILVTSRNQIKGLTTAAGLWACACLGLAIGVGFYTLAISTTILITIVLSILPIMEKFFTRNSRRFEIHIEFETRENLKQFVNTARTMGFEISSIEKNPAYASSGLSVYSIQLKVKNKKGKINHKSFLEAFSNLEYVNYVEIIY